MTTAARGPASVTPERTADGQFHASGGLVAEIRDLHVDLTRNNTTLKVLRGVDLDIRKGEILGLVGESGSGKSVLGLTLLGLLPIASDPQTSGSATVAGVDMLTGSAEVRRIGRQAHLGAVFQDPMTSLNPTMRVGRQVAEAAGSGTEALKLLTAVGIPDAGRRMSSYPHELSGGLRQRVMIAMAVAGNPDLVIADEPTTALDVTVQAQVLTLLARLRDELGCSVLMITHDLGVAAQVADRIAVLYAGRLAEVGPTAAVLRDPAHPYPAGLLASRLSLNTDRTRPIRVLAGSLPDPAKPLSGCAYAPRCALRMPECDTAPPELTPVPIAIVVVDSRADAVGGGADAVGSPAGGVGGRAGQPQHLHACLADVSAVRTLRAALDGSSRLDGSSTRDGSSIEGNGTGRAGSDAVVPDAVALDAVGPDGVGPDRVGPDGVALDASGPAVRIAKVTKTYRVKAGRGRKVPLHALRGVSLTVGQGEAVAIVGESGSGKTTLLRVVAGLERPDQATGAVRVGSGPRSQMVFQDAGASLTPWLTVGSLLEERLRSEGIPRSERRSRAVQALRHVGLPPETAEARAAELSGGQRQRVALARAIVVPPRLLLCDEPTSALDVSLAASVLNLIQTLRRELSMAVIFVTHDVSVARVIADRIAVMYLGRIVELGSAEELTTHPKHPYTKNLLAAVPDFGAAPPPMAGEPASALNPPTGCGFHPRCGFAQPACGDPQLDVPLVKLTVGAESLTDAADRRVACIRPEVI